MTITIDPTSFWLGTAAGFAGFCTLLLLVALAFAVAKRHNSGVPADRKWKTIHKGDRWPPEADA